MAGINPRLATQNISLTKRVEAKPVDEQDVKTQEKAQVAKPEVKAPESNLPTVRVPLSNLQQMVGIKPIKAEVKAQAHYELTLDEYRDLLARKDFHFEVGDSITIAIEPGCLLEIYIEYVTQGRDGEYIYKTLQSMDRF